MANTEPLENFFYPAYALPAQEIIRRLQKHGFYECYETMDGHVEIKGQYGLKCQVQKNADNYWAPKVLINLLSSYIVIPCVACIMLGEYADLGDKILASLSISIGFGIGGLKILSRQTDVLKRIREAVFE